MRPHWLWPVFSMELRKVFSYRVDFWFYFVAGTALFFTISYMLWTSVFDNSGATQMGGFDRNQMIFYFFLVPFFDRVIRSNEIFFLSHEIYEGGLTKYLLYPVSVLGFKYVGQLAHAAIAYLQFWVVFLFYLYFFPVPAGVELSISNTLMALVTMFLANALHFLILNVIEMTAFWADNVWSLSVMTRNIISIFGGYVIPISLFPSWSQPILKYLPFGYLIGFPVKVMMGQVSPDDWIFGISILLLWLCIISLIGRTVWQRGVLNYAGVGI